MTTIRFEKGKKNQQQQYQLKCCQNGPRSRVGKIFLRFRSDTHTKTLRLSLTHYSRLIYLFIRCLYIYGRFAHAACNRITFDPVLFGVWCNQVDSIEIKTWKNKREVQKCKWSIKLYKLSRFFLCLSLFIYLCVSVCVFLSIPIECFRWSNSCQKRFKHKMIFVYSKISFLIGI